MREIVVTDLDHVAVDGGPPSAVTDILFNFYDPERWPGLKGDMLAALHAWDDARVAAHRQEVASLHQAGNELVAAKDAEIAKLQADLAEQAKLTERALADAGSAAEMRAGWVQVTADHEAEVAKLNAELAEQATLIAALGGETLAKARARQAREQQLLDQQARIRAELASIQGGD